MACYENWLDEQEFTGRSGKPVSISQILVILSTPFYYGKFQYPEAPDGTWYTGAHKPLISKELYDLVQATRGVYKGVWGSKVFSFRGLLTCGRCGADITAQDKYKTLKSGEVKRFIYYNCTRRKDPNCPEKYINEPTLCEKLLEFIEANHEKMRFSDKLMAKAEKHHNVTSTLFNHYKVERVLDIPLIEYSRYILTKGTESEMTAFADGITTNLQIKESTLEFL